MNSKLKDALPEIFLVIGIGSVIVVFVGALWARVSTSSAPGTADEMTHIACYSGGHVVWEGNTFDRFPVPNSFTDTITGKRVQIFNAACALTWRGPLTEVKEH